MICKLCGFRASDRPGSQIGSMNLHAIRKHKEPDYKKLFEEKTEEKNEHGAGSTAKDQKTPSKKPNPVNNWRLLNHKDPRERLAIEKGFSMVLESGSDPDNWDLK